jgi:hypothetical protein
MLTVTDLRHTASIHSLHVIRPTGSLADYEAGALGHALSQWVVQPPAADTVQ